MRVTVEGRKCTGHGRCYDTAPDVFEPGDDGLVSVRGETIEVPAHLEAQAVEAIGSCPETALKLEERP